MDLTIILTPAVQGGFVALNSKTGIATQGETIKDALFNLTEATELFLEAFPVHIGVRSC